MFLTVCAVAQAQETTTIEYQNPDIQYVEVHADSVQRYDYLHHYGFWDNWFIGAQVGISHSMSENTRFGDFFKAERPSFTFQVGKFFFPSFGMRLTAGYKPQRGRANWELCDLWPETYGFYDFNVFAGYVDGLVNFTNILFPYSENHKFNVIGILGLGYNRSFGFDKDKINTWDKYHVETTPGNYFAAHAGLEATYAITKSLDLSLEATFNGTDDWYNGVEFDRVYDTYFDVQVGLKYHFKDQHGHHRFKYISGLSQDVLNIYNDKIADEKANLEKLAKPVLVEVEKPKFGEQLQTTISFYIDRYYITDAQKRNVASVAKFLENHPNVNLVVTGYADVETAYPEYNKRLSQKRAKAVYDMLTKEFGVSTDRLRMDFKGDAVQPFGTVNEWNRAVVFLMESADHDNVYDIVSRDKATETQVVIPAGTINPELYRGRKDITKIIISEGVTEIPDGAFEGCWALAEVVLPKSLKRIGAKAFNGTILQRVELPSQLEYIGDEAFQNSSMVEIDIPSGHKPTLGKDVFSTADKFILRVIVPARSITTFKADKEWNRADNITNIGAYWQ